MTVARRTALARPTAARSHGACVTLVRMAASRRCTYRVQLRPGFGFREAAGIAGYLARLGVSHLYTSPYLAAAPGSSHGYDVVDHGRVNPELGGEEAHEALRSKLADSGLSQVVDVVPNHMAIGSGNAWWWDVLENGRSSRYASYFDVDWDPPESKLRDTVLLPVLGDHYGRVLGSGGLRLERDGGRFLVRHGEQTYPCSPKTIDRLLAEAGLDDLAIEAADLPSSEQDDQASIAERHERKERLATEIETRCAADPDLARELDAAVARVNADPDALDDLLLRQNYRLAFWRVASQELDYRRFFDITDLVALRVEREHVFRDTHALVLEWARSGRIDGIRVDHPDGLRDPQEYFERVADAAPGAWLLAEKILQLDERLPGTWPVAGTTGYEFGALASGLFVERGAETALTALYAEITGERRPYADVLYEAKHDVMRGSLAADLERLTVFFVRICGARRQYRDHTRADLREVLRETVACFPAYRSYVRAEHEAISGADARAIEAATLQARSRRPELDPDLFDLLRDILLLRITGPNETGLVMRLQQFTAPVMAKGAEDTAFYRYSRLVALNEVGGEPGHFGTTLSELHDHNQRVQAEWPGTLLATSTHDTKRSEDVRLRIALLSQDVGGWAAAVRRWRTLTARHRVGDLPDGETEYLLYQTLVGAYPLPVDRALAYMEKATREAKRRTSWDRPDESYEAAIRAFVEGVLGDPAFTDDLAAFARRLVPPSREASLALVLLKLTSPGIPDLYQGTELWDLSLVDPDNRRPVDFAAREALLAELDTLRPADVLARSGEGLPKLFLIARALALRARREAAFAGAYRPICATGPRGDDVIAYARGDEVIAVAPCRMLERGPWEATLLPIPQGRWRDVLTGAAVAGGETPVAGLLEGFPVALLERA